METIRFSVGPRKLAEQLREALLEDCTLRAEFGILMSSRSYSPGPGVQLRAESGMSPRPPLSSPRWKAELQLRIPEPFAEDALLGSYCPGPGEDRTNDFMGLKEDGMTNAALRFPGSLFSGPKGNLGGRLPSYAPGPGWPRVPEASGTEGMRLLFEAKLPVPFLP